MATDAISGGEELAGKIVDFVATLQSEDNTPDKLVQAMADALAALQAKFARDEAAFVANPTDPALLAQERKEIS